MKTDDILKVLVDLKKQATTDRSHYYTGEACDRAIREIHKLRSWVNDLQSQLFLNCVYCGHRTDPEDYHEQEVWQVLQEHAEQCEHHPMYTLKQKMLGFESFIQQCASFGDMRQPVLIERTHDEVMPFVIKPQRRIE